MYSSYSGNASKVRTCSHCIHSCCISLSCSCGGGWGTTMRGQGTNLENGIRVVGSGYTVNSH